MARTHIVEASETLTSIAMLYGFSSTDAIWNHPRNEHLHTRWPQRNKPYIGDAVYIPDKTPKTVSLMAYGQGARPDQRFVFKQKTLKQYLSVPVEDEDGNGYVNTAYRMQVTMRDGTHYSKQGRTDSNGVLTEILPANAKSIVLNLATDAGELKRHLDLGATQPAKPAEEHVEEDERTDEEAQDLREPEEEGSDQGEPGGEEAEEEEETEPTAGEDTDDEFEAISDEEQLDDEAEEPAEPEIGG